MRNLVFIILIISLGVCHGQSKKELIDVILKSEMLECDCVGIGCMEGENYLKFKTLASKISKEELVELSKHTNAILRMYASIELLNQGDGNVIDMFQWELSENESIEKIEGCLIENQKTYSIIYNEYRGKIFYKIYEEDLSAEETSAKQEKLIKADKILAELDKQIINSKINVGWLLYKYIFEFRKYDEPELKNIAELAFTKNNSFALFYLIESHNSDYSSRIENYFKTQFLKAEFDSFDGIFYFHSIIEYLLETENNEYKRIAIEKLRTDNSWKVEQSWFKNTLEKYGVEL